MDRSEIEKQLKIEITNFIREFIINKFRQFSIDLKNLNIEITESDLAKDLYRFIHDILNTFYQIIQIQDNDEIFQKFYK